MKDTHTVIIHPLSTEKSIRLMEKENKIIFRVAPDATKQDVKNAVEELYKVKLAKVHTFKVGSEKRAYVKLAPENQAIDLATQLGLM